MLRLLPLALIALLAACAAPGTGPVVGAMSATYGPYRPSGPAASLGHEGRHTGTILPFRQANGPGRATVSLMEAPLSPAARAVEAPGFTEVFGRVMEGVRLAAERSGSNISLRAAGTVSANGEPLLRCGQVVHADDGPPLGLWCAGVVAERLAVIHVRTLDTPNELAAAAEFASVALIALRRGAERVGPGAPPAVEPPAEYRRRGRDIQA
jgi:hypothetical protein